MGLSDPKENAFGWSTGKVLAGTWFMSSFVLALFMLGVRATQAKSDLPGLEVVPALASGVGFALAARMFDSAHGGIVFSMQAVATLIVGSIARKLMPGSYPALKAKANDEFMQFEVQRLFLMLVMTIIGTSLASFLIWLFAGSDIINIVHTPGPFPGLNDDTQLAWGTFAFEVMATSIVGFVITYYALTGGSEGVADDERKSYNHGLKIAAFTIAVLTAMGWNIGGASFDVVMWTIANIFAGLAPVQVFGANNEGEFKGMGSYWWVYVLGSTLGWFVGIIIAYIVAGFAVSKTPAAKPEEKKALTENSTYEARIGAAHRNGGRLARGGTAMEELSVANGLFDRVE